MADAARTVREAKVQSVFEHIAEGYDRANMRISLFMQAHWKNHLIRMIADCVPYGCRFLDVCCGTGDIAAGVAAKRADLDITGVDFSSAMLRVAEQKHVTGNLHFQKGNALELPFENDRFRVSAISFGLRNTSDYKKAMQEMTRVTQRGGWVFCLDSMVPEKQWVLPFYKLYFRYIMPVLGGGRRYYREYQWLNTSTEGFLKKEELKKLFAETGCIQINTKSWLFGSCVLVWGRTAG